MIDDDPETHNPFTETWPKACGCGVKISEDDWEKLKYVGVQKTGLDGIPDLELRNCRCGSTLAVAVPGDFA
jgi:hypothetical protein